MSTGPGVKPHVIGSILRAARLERGLSTRACASVAGVSNSHLVRVELGQMQPTVETLVRLAGAVGIPPAVLVDDAIAGPAGFHAAARNCKELTAFIVSQKWGSTQAEDWACAFVSCCCRVVDHMVRLSFAQRFARRIPYPLKAMRKPYVDFAKEVDAGFTAADRLDCSAVLMTHGYGFLKARGLMFDSWIVEDVGAFVRSGKGALWMPFNDERALRLLPGRPKKKALASSSTDP